MLNKKLLATALAIAVSPAALGAGSTTVTSHVISAESATGATVIQSPAFTIALASEYVVGDQIAMTFAGNFHSTNAPATATNTETNAGNNSTLALLSISGQTVTYRLTGVTGTTVGSTFTFAASNFKFDASAMDTSAGAVTMAWTGIATDSVVATPLISYGVPEFTATVTKKANAKVDVAADRKNFAVATGQTAVLEDITITIADAANDGTTAHRGASLSTFDAATTVSFLGDFSWMATGSPLALRTGYTLTCTGCSSVAPNATFTQVDAVGIAGVNTLNINIPAAGNANSVATIPVGSYTASAGIQYDATAVAGVAIQTNAIKTVTLADAGANALNATSVTIYSMPFSSAVTPFLWVANNSTSAGTVTATITNAGTVSAEYALGSVAANTNKHIAQALKTAAGADYPTSGRGNITVTSTSSKTKVTGGYKVGDDRASLENSDTLNSDQITQ